MKLLDTSTKHVFIEASILLFFIEANCYTFPDANCYTFPVYVTENCTHRLCQEDNGKG